MSAASTPLILIVGLQKSGTSLLFRLLQQAGMAVNPFKTEGDAFWGNLPQLAPSEFPAGTIYQREGGRQGHAIAAQDATDEVRAVLCKRLADAAASAETGAPLANKNPYNTVRLPWLRALFPQAYIVAMVRRPLPNAYSLAKKYVPHEKRGLPPREGWWGVQPPGWQALVEPDKLAQSARQWCAVNVILQRDRACADRVIAYDDLCARPHFWLEAIAREWGAGPAPSLAAVPETLRSQDDEHLRGAQLRSKNRYFRQRGDFTLPPEEEPEFPPLAPGQAEALERLCAETAALLPELHSPAGDRIAAGS